MSDDPNQAGAASSEEAGFSQADIDALMGGAAGATESPAPEDSGTVSQADIDALMGGAAGATESPAPEDSGTVSQADIDALLSGAAADTTESAGDPAPASPPDERVDSLGRPFDEAAAMMQAAMDEEKAAAAAAPAPAPAPEAVPPPPPGSAPPNLTNFDATIAGVDPNRVSMLNDVKLRVKIELGRTRMLVEDVLKLGEGAVVELDKLAGDPVDVYVNDRLVARGEVLVLNDSFCVRVSDVISNDPHRVSA